VHDDFYVCNCDLQHGFVASPYYTESHVKFRKICRDFVENEMKPILDELLAKGELYPLDLHRKVYEAGISGVIYPKEYGGTRPDDYDTFYELIMLDEFARVGGGGILGQLGTFTFSLLNLFVNALFVRDKLDGITTNHSIRI